MSSEAKLIHGHIWDPAKGNLFLKPKKSERCTLTTIRCAHTEGCGVYARGQCISAGFLSWCKLGKHSTEEGLTGRARGYRDQIDKWKAMLDEHGNPRMEGATNKATRIGDFVWLPYAHMNVDGEGIALIRRTDPFLPLRKFTPEWVAKQCAYRPRAVFGGEIAAYQRDVVPLFVAHLKEEFPEILAEAAKLSAKVREVLASLTHVGRKARLHTLVPNVGTFEGWMWDGEALWTDDEALARKVWGLPGRLNARTVRLVPVDGVAIKIEDDNQVGPDTVFVD